MTMVVSDSFQTISKQIAINNFPNNTTSGIIQIQYRTEHNDMNIIIRIYTRFHL